MDKFHGISRAEITNTRHSYEIVERELPKYRCVARSGDGEAGAGKRESDNFLPDKAEPDMHRELGTYNIVSDTQSDNAVSSLYDKENPYDKDAAYHKDTLCSFDDCAGQGLENDDENYRAVIKPKSKSRTKESRGGFFTVLRYGICAAVLLVCLLGKFTTLAPLKEASGFIKDELNREILTELYDADDE